MHDKTDLTVSPSFARSVSFALVLEDNVLDLWLVFKDALAIVLCFRDLILNNFTSLNVGLD